MAELQIYDSQGSPIRGEAGRDSERVKDFFFDGVRFAVDKNRNEMFCFFRARDNDTARSEQYYAKYNYQSRSEMNNIVSAVENRIEGEYGMTLDTDNDDTQFFELLSSSSSGRTPADMSTVEDVEQLLSGYHQAKLGVGSYSEAFGLFSKLFSNSGVNKIAVSDNATGSSVSSYDLVIEKGSHMGVEALGDTADELESLREQRRATFDPNYEPGDNSDSGLSGPEGALLFGGVGVLVVLVALYGTCLGLGMAIPGIDSPPGVGTCGDAEPALNSISAEIDQNDSQQLQVSGNTSGMAGEQTRLNVSITSGGETLNSNSSDRSIGEDGTFEFSVPIQQNESNSVPDGEYNVTVTINGMTAETMFTVGNETGTPETNETGTPETNESSTPENDSTSENGTTEGITNITVPDTVDGQTDIFGISGTTAGLNNSTVAMTVDFAAGDGTPLSGGGEQQVEIANDGTFEFNVSFDPADTEGPYTVTVTHNGSSVDEAFESSADTEQFDSIDVGNVDNGQLSLTGTTSNIDSGTNVTAEVEITDDGGTDVYNSTELAEIDDSGQFDLTPLEFGDVPSGTYSISVTIDGTTRTDTFTVE